MQKRPSKLISRKMRFTTEEEFQRFQELAFARGIRWASQASSPYQRLERSKPAGIILKGTLLDTCFVLTSTTSAWQQSSVEECAMKDLINLWEAESADVGQAVAKAG